MSIYIYTYIYILCIHVGTCKSHVSLPNVPAEGYAGCFIRQAVKFHKDDPTNHTCCFNHQNWKYKITNYVEVWGYHGIYRYI